MIIIINIDSTQGENFSMGAYRRPSLRHFADNLFTSNVTRTFDNTHAHEHTGKKNSRFYKIINNNNN